MVAFFLTCIYSNARHIDHARLKDHVTSMNGGLEAKINEGGESHCIQTPFPTIPWLALSIGSIVLLFWKWRTICGRTRTVVVVTGVHPTPSGVVTLLIPHAVIDGCGRACRIVVLESLVVM